MRYQEHRPGSPLSDFVEAIWTLEGDARDLPGRVERILPDGCVEWIVNLGDPVREVNGGAIARAQPRRFVVGQMDHALCIEPAGVLRFLGVRFQPAGAAPFFRARMRSLAGSRFDAGAIDVELDRELAERLDPRAAPAEWALAAERVLARRALGLTPPDALAAAATAHLVACEGRVAIEALSTELGCSRRRLERAFDEHVGLPPKLLARILRFQRVYRRAQGERVDWIGLALDAGYYDQAHLIRDFRAFAGTTPASLLALEGPLTASFSRRARVSQSSNRPRG
jgi:AraC-like DNA-binding protein